MIDMSELTKIAPLGTVLPFDLEDELPKGWLKFDGSVLEKKDYPGLHERIWSQLDIWLKMGGNISNSAIVLPNIDSPNDAMELAFGYRSDPPMNITLAIKASRE